MVQPHPRRQRQLGGGHLPAEHRFDLVPHVDVVEPHHQKAPQGHADGSAPPAPPRPARLAPHGLAARADRAAVVLVPVGWSRDAAAPAARGAADRIPFRFLHSIVERR
jgi:hypothetical protein